MIERYRPLSNRVARVTGALLVVGAASFGCERIPGAATVKPAATAIATTVIAEPNIWDIAIEQERARVITLQELLKKEEELAALRAKSDTLSRQIDALYATPTGTPSPVTARPLTVAEAKGTALAGALVQELADRAEARAKKATPVSSPVSPPPSSVPVQPDSNSDGAGIPGWPWIAGGLAAAAEAVNRLIRKKWLW